MVLCVKQLLAGPTPHNGVLVRVFGTWFLILLNASASWKSEDDRAPACSLTPLWKVWVEFHTPSLGLVQPRLLRAVGK